MKPKMFLPFLALFAATNGIDAGGGGGETPDPFDRNPTGPAAKPADDPATTDGSTEPEMEIEEATPAMLIGSQGRIAVPATDLEQHPDNHRAESFATAAVEAGAEFTPESEMGKALEQTATIGDAAPEPETTAAGVARFDQQFPSFGTWFDRVQKWAQFNSRPVPEPSGDWQSAFEEKVAPDQAAAELCLPQP